MITKNLVTELKNGNNGELEKLLNVKNDFSTLFRVLDNLGRLPNNFNGKCFIPLLNHENSKIRLLAIKNIGKLGNEEFLPLLNQLSEKEDNTIIRREAVSSIGRMRSSKAIPFLVKKLDDPDPKVVLQAVRALLVFKNIVEVRKQLQKLITHPNEIIKNVIEKEFAPLEKHDPSKPKHSESPDFLKNLTVKGDVLKVLDYVPEESIHLTFTSPPYYNARDYSIYQSYQEYLEFLNDVFSEVYRITKEGRFFILNTSPIIIPRVSRQHASKRYPIPFDIHPYLIKIGWEFIDDIVWVKPEASAKDRNSSFRQHRKPLAYKPTAVTEYLMVYRKKTHKLIDWNMRQYKYKTVQESKVLGEIDKINTWCVDPTFDKTHTAVFPVELCNKVIQYYSFKGDLVFDPFGGSGTFGKSAMILERFFFLTEMSSEYFKRIKHNLGQNNLFSLNKQPRFLTLEDIEKIMKERK